MTDGKTTLDTIVESNLGLVHSCANRFRGRGVEYEDLFQAGCLGLVKAAKNFDSSKGFAFSTYAVPVILGEIKRIFRDGGSVKIGRTLKEKARQISKQKDEITVTLGREPTVSELAESLGIDPAEAAMLINASLPVVSLTYSDDSENMIEIPVESHENEISDSVALHQVLSALDEKDRLLIELRFYKRLTQSETAVRLGMTQVQISRRERILLGQIRKKLET